MLPLTKPYGFDPNYDFCITPRVASKAELRGFVLEKVLRLAKTASTYESEHTLDLTIDMDGTDVFPAIWTIEASTVPSWLSLPLLKGSIGDTEQSGNLSLTASTTGLAERLATPYEALLNLTVMSQLHNSFLVHVKLYVSAPTLASTSVWGRPTSERECLADVASELEPIEVSLGVTVDLPFSACDLDGLTVDHDDPGSFEAVLIDRSNGAARSLSVAYDLPGTYVIAVVAFALVRRRHSNLRRKTLLCALRLSLPLTVAGQLERSGAASAQRPPGGWSRRKWSVGQRGSRERGRESRDFPRKARKITSSDSMV